MKQIELLRRIVAAPGIFSCPGARAAAKDELFKKLRRHNIKIKKRTQTKLEL